jgi:hypothetical protein
MKSKIYLLVDIGYAFDYYSVLEIKQKLNLLSSDTLDLVKQDLISQLDKDSFNSIIESKEYKELLDANQKTFDAVELARYGNITAKEVDDCNMLRYNAKIALQRTFVPTEYSTIEVKT